MEYCKNWDKTKQRFAALWQGEIIDRCCASIIAPLGNPGMYGRLPDDPAERAKYRTDGEWILKRNLAIFDHTYFAGDAFPMLFPDLGAAGHAGFFKGANYQLGDTVWFFPSIEEWQPDSLCFDRESFLYKKTLELARFFVQESKGRYFVSMPDTSGNLDALAHLRGSENVMMDLLTDPEPVHDAMAKIQEAWKDIVDKSYEIIKDNNEGGSCIGWLYTWAPGFHSQMQSDISVMLSPELFRGFVYPELAEQCSHLEYPLYHFDGYQQTRHLDMLLSIENLKMIQWTHVAGQPSPVHFIPTLKRIQEAGKGLLLLTNVRDMELLMEQLSSKGLYFIIYAGSKEEAEYAEKRIAELTHE